MDNEVKENKFSKIVITTLLIILVYFLFVKITSFPLFG